MKIGRSWCGYHDKRCLGKKMPTALHFSSTKSNQNQIKLRFSVTIERWNVTTDAHKNVKTRVCCGLTHWTDVFIYSLIRSYNACFFQLIVPAALTQHLQTGYIFKKQGYPAFESIVSHIYISLTSSLKADHNAGHRLSKRAVRLAWANHEVGIAWVLIPNGEANSSCL